MSRLSGLQHDVLVLYRNLLRSSIKRGHGRSTEFYQFVKSEFRDKANSVQRNDFRLIEHLLRQGYKKKKLIDLPGFSCAASSKSKIIQF